MIILFLNILDCSFRRNGNNRFICEFYNIHPPLSTHKRMENNGKLQAKCVINLDTAEKDQRRSFGRAFHLFYTAENDQRQDFGRAFLLFNTAEKDQRRSFGRAFLLFDTAEIDQRRDFGRAFLVFDTAENDQRRNFGRIFYFFCTGTIDKKLICRCLTKTPLSSRMHMIKPAKPERRFAGQSR